MEISIKKQKKASESIFFASQDEKNPHFCLHFKEKHYFCRVIRQEQELMKSFNFAYYFFFYFYFSHKVEREFVCVK